jgi:hypothetical protein
MTLIDQLPKSHEEAVFGLKLSARIFQNAPFTRMDCKGKGFIELEIKPEEN